MSLMHSLSQHLHPQERPCPGLVCREADKSITDRHVWARQLGAALDIGAQASLRGHVGQRHPEWAREAVGEGRLVEDRGQWPERADMQGRRGP